MSRGACFVAMNHLWFIMRAEYFSALPLTICAVLSVGIHRF